LSLFFLLVIPEGICFCQCFVSTFSAVHPPQTSSRPKAALAAAVKRSLYFAFAVAVVFAIVSEVDLGLAQAIDKAQKKGL
jgi:hypothetical protein